MTCDELRKILGDRGVSFTEGPTQNGTRFNCPGKEIFNVFDSGKMSFQGNQATALAKEVRAIHEGASPVRETSEPITGALSSTANRGRTSNQASAPIFIVYGHDVTARDQLELLLHRMDLEPIVLANLSAAGDTIIEKLERYLGDHGDVGFACVLLTPDDEGHKAGKSEDKKYRARQNVVLELGMVLARLGRRRVAILHKQSIELPSDINGLIYISFTERIDEVKTRLYNELREAGYNPNSSALN